MPDILSATPWDTRNLHRPTYHLDFAQTKSVGLQGLPEALKTLVTQHNEFFVSARIPEADRNAHSFLQGLGFQVAELTIYPHLCLTRNPILADFIAQPKNSLPKEFHDHIPQLLTIAADDNDKLAIIRELAGECFLADRIHRDPLCTMEIGDQRYRYWIDDMVANGRVTFFLLQHGEEPAGFLAHRAGEVLLVGISPAYQGRRLGDYLWLSCLAEMLKSGVEKVHTTISAANISALNLHGRLGFRFSAPEWTYHYWYPEYRESYKHE